ncbi:hypothetical protein NSQ77_18315 [Oceanobacillus sp. FSL K6-2867]
MRELIGTCVKCKEEVYCKDGFFDGVHKGGKLFCNPCAAKLDKKEL